MDEVTVIQLRDALVEYFNIGELKELCLELDVDYESFGGEGKAGKALEMAQWSKRYGRMEELATIIKQKRPKANLSAANPPQQPAQSATQGGGNVYNIGTVIGGVVGDGSVNAENIASGDISIDKRTYSADGDMYVAGGDMTIHAPETKEAFNTQLAELQQLVQEIVAAGVIADQGDAEDTISGLNSATQEIEKAQPNSKRIKRKLETVMEILETAKDTATVVGKTAVALAKAAALSGVLFETASKLFS